MRKQNKRNEDREFILGIIVGRNKDNAVSMEEIQDITGFSKEKIRRIIYHLVVESKFPIALKTEFFHSFYMKKKNFDEKEKA